MSDANIIAPASVASDRNARLEAKRQARIPMSVPVRKLEVPEIPGMHPHWFLESNIPRAIQAGYEFVERGAVPIHTHSLGSSPNIDGNQDLGSRISIADGPNAQGMPQSLVLMAIEEELWREDLAKIGERNAAIMGSIFRGEKILEGPGDPQTADDRALRYVDKERTKAIFNRPTRKSNA